MDKFLKIKDQPQQQQQQNLDFIQNEDVDQCKQKEEKKQ